MDSKQTLEHAFAGMPELIDRKKLAEIIGLKPHTFSNWLWEGRFVKELPVIKIGRSVRYRKSDVIAFIVNQTLRGAQ